MMTNYTGNMNTVGQLQNALKNLEDRCQKLQRRTDTLQAENERLLAGRAELLAEVERLQEQQIRLRERNLRLTQEFHAKQQECSLLAEKLTMFARGRVDTRKRIPRKNALTELSEDGEGSVDSLEYFNETSGRSTASRREPQILSKSKRTLSEPNLSVIQRELDQVRKGLWTKDDLQEDSVEKLSTTLLTNIKKEQNELEEQFTRIVDIQKNSLEMVNDDLTASDNTEDSHLTRCTKSTQSAVRKLQAQQTILKKLHDFLNSKGKSQVSGCGTSVVTQTSWNGDQGRICPLCEVNFPSTVSLESFEDHVMEHFSNEDCILPDFEILT